MHIIRIIAGLVLLLFAAGCVSLASSRPHSADTLCAKVGQEWAYQTRPGEENSRLIIASTFLNKERQRLYIVRLTNISIDSPYYKNYYPDGVPYYIITEAALAASVTKLIGDSDWNPHYDHFYLRWQKEFQPKGVYNAPVSAVLDQLEEVLNIRLGA